MTLAGPQVRAYVLAAGLGQRLWPLTKDRPKSLVDLGGGATLLGRQLSVFLDHPAVSGVTVITGHMAHAIETFVADLGDERVDTRFNPFFTGAGPIGSLWAVRDQLLHEDFLICNGDTLFHHSVLDALVAPITDGPGIVLAASTVAHTNPDDVRVDVSSGGWVRHVGKGRDGAARSTGMVLVSGTEVRRDAVAMLDALVRDESKLAPGTPWHSWVDALAGSSDGVRVALIGDEEWSEVDIHPELEDLRAELASKLT